MSKARVIKAHVDLLPWALETGGQITRLYPDQRVTRSRRYVHITEASEKRLIAALQATKRVTVAVVARGWTVLSINLP